MAHTQTQKVAQAAYAAVSAVQTRKGAKPKEYLSFARAFPTLIHTCGLAQATAFALAKGNEQLAVLTDLASVLREAKAYPDAADGAALHQKVIGASVGEYLRFTRDALLVAGWLKRYAEALLDSDTPPRT